MQSLHPEQSRGKDSIANSRMGEADQRFSVGGDGGIRTPDRVLMIHLKDPLQSRGFFGKWRKLAILGSVSDCIKLPVFRSHPGKIPARKSLRFIAS